MRLPLAALLIAPLALVSCDSPHLPSIVSWCEGDVRFVAVWNEDESDPSEWKQGQHMGEIMTITDANVIDPADLPMTLIEDTNGQIGGETPQSDAVVVGFGSLPAFAEMDFDWGQSHHSPDHLEATIPACP